MLKNNAFLLLLSISMLMHGTNSEFSGLITILQYLGLFSNNSTLDWGTPMTDLGQSRGVCQYSFAQYALNGDRYYCDLDDKHILHLGDGKRMFTMRKPPIRVKCLQPEAVAENTTLYTGTLLVMQRAKDIVNLLKPIGNATKRHEPGSCVVILFCTPSSLGCATIAPVANMLPRFFPTLRIAYIDSYKFSNFNAEFGVVGLPTLLLFHQGRPVVKYYADDKSFSTFITIHTGIKPMKPVLAMEEINGPLPIVPIEEPDQYLLLAWGVILICLINRLRQTNWWHQLVEMIQRNWRESEETQMEMVD